MRSGFSYEGLEVNEKIKVGIDDLSVRSGGAEGVCPITTIPDGRSAMTAVSTAVAAKLQAVVPDAGVITAMLSESW